MRAIETLKAIVGDRPVVMDRQLPGVLAVPGGGPGLLRHPPECGDSPEVSGLGRPGTGRARKRSIGMWGTKGWSAFGNGVTPNPWEPEEALRMDLQRMKIDATFRDRKDRLGLERRMNQSQESMEKMVAWLYRAPRGGESEGLLVRAAAFGESPDPPEPASPAPRPSLPRSPGIPQPRPGQAGRDGRGSGRLRGRLGLPSCPNSCPNLSRARFKTRLEGHPFRSMARRVRCSSALHWTRYFLGCMGFLLPRVSEGEYHKFKSRW